MDDGFLPLHRRFAVPAVTETGLALEPVSRDPFIDGLSGTVASRAPAPAGSRSVGSGEQWRITERRAGDVR
jgi:hypothetical protein